MAPKTKTVAKAVVAVARTNSPTRSQSPKGAKSRRPRNRKLADGVYQFSAASMDKKKGVWRVSKLKPKTAKASATASKVTHGTPRSYPADDVKRTFPRNFSPKIAKLRSTITPGTVLIMLAGRFRGKRVVFLKQLPSGALLVTGPFKINGVPLRRVNQTYVIATSVKLDLKKAHLPEVTEEDLRPKKAKAASKGEAEFFDGKQGPVVSARRKELQSQVDTEVLAAIEKVDKLTAAYLRSKFTLRSSDRPHEMAF